MVTQDQVNSILKAVLTAHELDTRIVDGWIKPHDRLPAIRCLWNNTNPGRSGRLDVQVLVDENVLLEECFAGLGNELDALHDALQNFCINSLHVMLAAFWNIVDDEQVTIEDWNVKGTQCTAYIGNFGTRASDGKHPGVPEGAFEAIEKAAGSLAIQRHYHWAMAFFCNIGNKKEKIYEAKLDNQVWEAGEQALRKLSWPDSDGYYSVRNFFILKRKS